MGRLRLFVVFVVVMLFNFGLLGCDEEGRKLTKEERLARMMPEGSIFDKIFWYQENWDIGEYYEKTEQIYRFYKFNTNTKDIRIFELYYWVPGGRIIGHMIDDTELDISKRPWPEKRSNRIEWYDYDVDDENKIITFYDSNYNVIWKVFIYNVVDERGTTNVWLGTLDWYYYAKKYPASLAGKSEEERRLIERDRNRKMLMFEKRKSQLGAWESYFKGLPDPEFKELSSDDPMSVVESAFEFFK